MRQKSCSFIFFLVITVIKPAIFQLNWFRLCRKTTRSSNHVHTNSRAIWRNTICFMVILVKGYIQQRLNLCYPFEELRNSPKNRHITKHVVKLVLKNEYIKCGKKLMMIDCDNYSTFRKGELEFTWNTRHVCWHETSSAFITVLIRALRALTDLSICM